MTTRTHYFGSGSTPLWESNSAVGSDGKYENYQGVSRLKWNDFTAVFHREIRKPGRTPMYVGDQWWDCSSNKGSRMNANDILTLQSRLSESVKGHQFNLAVSAAEGGKTVNMVSNAVKSIGGAILDLKRGKFENAARRFGVAQRPSRLSEKDVAGRWLELQYGWIPLLSDVYESAKAYEAVTSPARTTKVQASISRDFLVESSLSPSNYSCKGVMKERWRIIYEATETMSTPRSLGLMDPATVAWELIPYSFVVDWFIPIGSYLENLNQIPSLSGRFMTIKTRRFSGSAIPTNPFVTWTSVPHTHNSYFGMERVVSTVLTVPKPQFVSLPAAMSPNRIWNAIALVTQRVR